LRRRFGVHDVLVESKLHLQLPETYRSRDFALYHIPEEMPATGAGG
jgi:hypothetical protein